jgi:uncharacterized protein (TIGR00369 family)
MNETTVDRVPEDFVRLPAGLGFTDNLQPCFRRIRGSEVSFGLLVDRQHSNVMGICHGGVLVTLADVAAATGVNVARGAQGGSPTVNLAVDFISAARMGQWIQADIHSVSVKRRFGFASGLIASRDGVVARFNGTFYLPGHTGMVKPEAIGDGMPGFLAD